MATRDYRIHGLQMFLTISEVADYLQVSEKLVRRWVRQGELNLYPAGTIGRSNLFSFLESRSNQNPQCPDCGRRFKRRAIHCSDSCAKCHNRNYNARRFQEACASLKSTQLLLDIIATNTALQAGHAAKKVAHG